VVEHSRIGGAPGFKYDGSWSASRVACSCRKGIYRGGSEAKWLIRQGRHRHAISVRCLALKPSDLLSAQTPRFVTNVLHYV
jgi:hypothetical protein